jgi:hypothetical protein
MKKIGIPGPLRVSRREESHQGQEYCVDGPTTPKERHVEIEVFGLNDLIGLAGFSGPPVQSLVTEQKRKKPENEKIQRLRACFERTPNHQAPRATRHILRHQNQQRRRAATEPIPEANQVGAEKLRRAVRRQEVSGDRQREKYQTDKSGRILILA